MNFMNIQEGEQVDLPGRGSRPHQVHVFDWDAIRAVNAALAARRPAAMVASKTMMTTTPASCPRKASEPVELGYKHDAQAARVR